VIGTARCARAAATELSRPAGCSPLSAIDRLLLVLLRSSVCKHCVLLLCQIYLKQQCVSDEDSTAVIMRKHQGEAVIINTASTANLGMLCRRDFTAIDSFLLI
jgi:hypothetical protein